jgi:DNA-directed RNA polymerase subunit N (RpoN/RPB10)
MTYEVRCPSCNEPLAKVAEGVPVEAMPERCPNCQVELPRDWNAFRRTSLNEMDPRRQHPGPDGPSRRSHPI